MFLFPFIKCYNYIQESSHSNTTVHISITTFHTPYSLCHSFIFFYSFYHICEPDCFFFLLMLYAVCLFPFVLFNPFIVSLHLSYIFYFPHFSFKHLSCPKLSALFFFLFFFVSCLILESIVCYHSVVYCE